MSTTPAPTKRPWWTWLVWGAAIALLIALFTRTSLPAERRTPVPYSLLKQELRNANVVEVSMKGHRLTGRFGTPVDAGDPKVGPVTAFTTRVPATGDDELLPLLEARGVRLTVEDDTAGVDWLTLLLSVAPLLLLVGWFVWLGRGGMFGRGPQVMGGLTRAHPRRHEDPQSRVRFDDVAGVDEAKADLMQVVQFLRQPERFHRVGATMPKGILLVGPPGTGKTLLARAVAGEVEVPFFSIGGSEFVEVFVGVGAGRVRDLFRQAKEAAPAILFVDEIDAVGRQRGTGLGGSHDEREQTLNQLLAEMDGFEPRDAVVVLAATNRPDVLDPALVRPGRFDRRVVLDLPDRTGREAILRVHAQKVPQAADVDLPAVARATPGFAGADLANLVNEAAIQAAQEEADRVTAAHFAAARERILLGPRRPLLLTDDQRRAVAFHEGGHALVGHLLPNADPVEVVTIIPHSQALGVTQQSPAEERYTYARPMLEDRLSALLAGRAADLLIGGQPTTGAEDDLKQATKLARRMVINWGMSERVGPVAFESGSEHPFLGREFLQPHEYSEETAALVDDEVRGIVEQAEQRALALLQANASALQALATALLEEESLSRARIEAILGPKAMPEPPANGLSRPALTPLAERSGSSS